MSQSRRHSRSEQCETRNDRGDPSNSRQVDRLAVGQLCFDASQTFTGGLILDIDLDQSIQIRDSVCNARDLGHDVWADLDIGLDVDLTGSHGAHALQVLLAWVNRL